MGSTATYECDPGFIIIGSVERECQNDGVWTGTPSTCTCKLLKNCAPKIEESIFIFLVSVQLSTVEVWMIQRMGECYSAQLRLAPLLPMSVTLDSISLETWNGHVRRMDSGQAVHQLVKVKQNHPLHIMSPTSSFLNFFILFCLTVADCGFLEDPENGVVMLSGNTVGSTATYECDAGYVLVGGEETRTCQENGQWSGAAPSCIRKSCYIP